MTQAAGKFNAVARKIKNCSPAAGFFRILPRARMKAIIVITPKKAVLDPQGKTVQNALAQMGYTGVTGVHIGKYIEALNDAAHKFLSNPVIEDYKLEIE